MKYLLLTASLFILCSHGFSQSTSLDKVRSYRKGNEQAIITSFFSFLQIPCVATDTANIGKNADFLVKLMQDKGIANVQLLQLQNKKIPPVVYGEVNVP